MSHRKVWMRFGGGASLTAMGIGVSQAASYIDPSVSGIFTQVGTDSGVLLGYGYVLLGIVTGGLVVMGLVKRLLHKAPT